MQVRSVAVVLLVAVLATGVYLVHGNCFSLTKGTSYAPQEVTRDKTASILRKVCGKYLDVDKMSGSTCCTGEVLQEYSQFLSDYVMCRACKATILSLMCNYCKEQAKKEITISTKVLETVHSACVYNGKNKNVESLFKGLCKQENHTACTAQQLLDELNSKWKLQLVAKDGEQSFDPPVYGCFQKNPEGKCCACGDCPAPCDIQNALFADLENVSYTFRPRTMKNSKQYTTIFVISFLVVMYSIIFYFMINRYPREKALDK